MINQELAFYQGFPGNNTSEADRASGAYVFRPLEQVPTILEVPNVIKYFVTEFITWQDTLGCLMFHTFPSQSGFKN